MRELGNLDALFTQWSAANPRPLSFLSANWRNLDAWKREGRAKAEELLCFPHGDVPLDPHVISSTDCGDMLRQDIEFTVCEGFRPRGTLLLPKGRGPYPAVLALHDHGGFYFFGREKVLSMPGEPPVLKQFRQDCYGGRSWGDDLARRGFAVLCMDAFYFGSSGIGRMSNGDDDAIRSYNKSCNALEPLAAKHFLASGLSWPGMLLLGDRRAIDFLSAHPVIDAGRIGCCGLSMGGFRSALLAGMDGRVRCAVVCAWMTTYATLIPEKLLNHTFMAYIPGLTRWMDLPDLAAMAAPNALMVQQCAEDWLFTIEGMRDACSVIGQTYEKAGSPEKFSSRFYDNDHQFNQTMQKDAFAWLETHLSL